MKIYHHPIELIIETPAVKGVLPGKDVQKKLNKVGISVEGIHGSNHGITKKSGRVKTRSSASPDKLYARTTVQDTEINPWDLAHLSKQALGASASFIEPDRLQEFVVQRKINASFSQLKPKSFGSGKSDDNFDPDWKPGKNLLWHLGDDYSQLKSARDEVDSISYPIRIAHFDTGYSADHFIVPEAVKSNKLQRSFVNGENGKDAHDRLSGGIQNMPGHGTGTLALLAGGKVKLKTDEGVFEDYLGGAWFAEVICCRLASSVILMKTSAFAEALKYITALTLNGKPIHVLSMSMGGAPAKSWADAVNDAYLAGITMVTAAGNNFNGLPTQHVVYPARFKRVIAACGVTYDYAPYHHRKIGEMQGCYGPGRHMSKALAAFTPNTPWASVESGTIRFSGAGTSSATPQIASAAAIYYRKYHNELDQLKPWQRVEAIRYALYNSSLKKVKAKKGTYTDYFGNGILQANAALQIPVNKTLPMTLEDSVPWFPILNTLFKNKTQQKTLGMFNTELAQLVYDHSDLAKLIGNEQKAYDEVSVKEWKNFREAVIESREASESLRKFLKENEPSTL